MKCKFLQNIVLLAIFAPTVVFGAEIPSTYTMENFDTAYHDAPASFSVTKDGNFFGVTSTGKEFSQIRIVSTISVRLHKFSIDESYFYMSGIGQINAKSDIEALSIYLSHYNMSLS